MSKLETNQVDPATGTTLTLGTSGDTITIPSGVTIANSGTATGFGGDNTPSFGAYLNANTSISSGSLTKLTINGEYWDTDNAFDSSSNYRFTVPSGEAGKYFFYAIMRMDSGSSFESGIWFQKNGSRIAKKRVKTGTSATNVDLSHIIDLSAGDYIEIYVYQDQGGSVSVNGDTNGTDEDTAKFFGYKLIGV